jgi:hypothetical protein
VPRKDLIIFVCSVRNRWASHQGCREGVPQAPFCRVATSIKYGWQYGNQSLPALWAPYAACSWQEICNRRLGEANCHLLAADTDADIFYAEIYLHKMYKNFVQHSLTYKCVVIKKSFFKELQIKDGRGGAPVTTSSNQFLFHSVISSQRY